MSNQGGFGVKKLISYAYFLVRGGFMGHLHWSEEDSLKCDDCRSAGILLPAKSSKQVSGRWRAVASRAVMLAAVFVLALSSIESTLSFLLAKRAAAQEADLKDPIAAITKYGRAPKPFVSDPAPAQPSFAAVGDEARAQAPNLTASPSLPNKLKAVADKISEDRSLQTENSKTFRNSDGSSTVEQFSQPVSYRKDGQLLPLSNKVTEERAGNVGENGVPAVLALPTALNAYLNLPPVVAYNGTDGPIAARFAKLHQGEGISFVVNGQNFTMNPLSGNQEIMPQRTTGGDTDVITYPNVWDGVDLVYEYHGESVKEFIVINKQPKSNSFGFTVGGGVILRNSAQDRGVIEAVKDGQVLFVLPSLSVSAEGRGPVSDSGASYALSGSTVTVNISSQWLSQQTDQNFPIIIDPTVSINISNASNDYTAYKSDGYVCPSSSCWLYAGNLQNNGTKYWRTAAHIPFTAADGKDLLGATLYLSRPTTGTLGTSAAARYWVTYAGCFGFNCIGSGAPWVPITVGLSGSADITPLVSYMRNIGAPNGWIFIHADDSPFKAFDAYATRVDLTYNTPPTTPTMVYPATNATVTTVSPRLEVNPSTDADGNALTYSFEIYNGTSFVASSGWLNATRWTVPEGLLQDGGTYSWRATVNDGYTQRATTQTNFTIDLRTGKDKTQTYDSAGPVSANMADGNVFTTTASHSLGALGGNIGIGLDYNTAGKSIKGLKGDYFNNTTATGAPVLSRNDPNIDFEWGSQSPKPGVVTADNFSVKWSGYFVAPETGNYTFGGSDDDTFSFSMDINRNGTYQQLFNLACCSAKTWATQSVALTAGQVYPISAMSTDVGSSAYARLWVKTATLTERIVPQDWLRTPIQPVTDNKGMIGRYYQDNGTHNFSTNTYPFLVQQYNEISLNWSTNSPMAYDPAGLLKDNFMARFSGYLIVPTTGTYTFGSGADDGQRIYVNGSLVAQDWATAHAFREVWSSGISLTAGQVVPITLEYYEVSSSASVNLQWTGPAGSGLVPSSYMVTDYKVLPLGWSLSIDGDGNLPYERLNVLPNGSIDLLDGDGANHRYTLNTTTGIFKAPVNEDGVLVRNQDYSYTLTDVDGRIYNFSTSGTLTSVTTPTDDRKPAALKYEYQDQSGAPRLSKIIDAVDTSRYGQLYYGGDSQCVTPSGFDSAPLGFLCAFKTTDNQVTNFYYKLVPNSQIKRLERVEQPGGILTDFKYDGNSNITSIRDPLANDVIATNQRADDATTNSELVYDKLGRIQSVKLPAATAGANRMEHTFEYYVGISGNGSAKRHITGATEPNGYQQYMEYDNLQRTTKVCDIAALCATTEWHATKDLALSATDATGLKSTTIYDTVNDRPTDSYGPAPTAWYAADRTPLATYASQVPHSQTRYDEGIQGLGISVYDNKKLLGAPKAYATGFNNVPTASYGVTPTAGVVTFTDGASIRATGKMLLSQTGNYSFRAWHSDGVRIYVDDQLVVNEWVDGAERYSASGTYNNTSTNHWVNYMVEVYKTGTTARVFAQLFRTPPGAAEQADISGYMTPAYNLVTSTKLFDAQNGDITNTTNYGSRPELGQVQSATQDSGGLNLTNNFTYEPYQPGSLLRQTSKSLPGGATTNYNYYGETETADNPCTVGTTEAYHQAGMPKGKADPDPDGAGPQTPRTTEAVYDDTGRTVASRYNNDAWTCLYYDARSRITQTVIPAIGTEAGRTITNNYAVDGNPLKRSVTDANGTITTQFDILGRTTVYSDAAGTWTGYEYDNLGRLTHRWGDMGEELYTYDNLNRLTEQKLDGTVLATPHYDTYGRTTSVDYPAAGTMRLSSVNRDNLQRVSQIGYTFADGTTVTDATTRSQSGPILTNTVTSGASSFNYAYSYDKSARLTGATAGTNTFSYGFGSQDASCAAATNPNSGKDSNRTTQTINGVTTTYCYDYADRLVSSSDPSANGATYDAHGNTTHLGTGASSLNLHYDSSDRNWGLVQYDSNGDGNAVYYNRDAMGRITSREHDTITGWTWNLAQTTYNGYTNSNDAPSLLRDANWNIVEKYVHLPGGLLLTIKPQETTQTTKHTYSLPNLHGDTLLTANGLGTNTSTGSGPASAFTYDPFGNPLPATPPSNAYPTNTTTGSNAYLGIHQKSTETVLALHPIQMGARVYFPTLGRFAQVDPVEGGTLNSYVYALDPVNQRDLSGRCVFGVFCADTISAPAMSNPQATAPATIIQATVSHAVNVVRYPMTTKIVAKNTPYPLTIYSANRTALSRVDHVEIKKIPGNPGTTFMIYPTAYGRATLVISPISSPEWTAYELKKDFGISLSHSMYIQLVCHGYRPDVTFTKPSFNLDDWRSDVGLIGNLTNQCNPN
jgi:RHS repeat-associated protein